MKVKRIIPIILICLFLLLPMDVFAAIAKVGAEADFNGDVNISSGSKYLINSTQISSDALFDVASIAMLDEEETVTGVWSIYNNFNLIRDSDINEGAGLSIIRRRDGDPTYNVSDGDILGWIDFIGYHSTHYNVGGFIQALVDGTSGDMDMPTRLEFATTPDGAHFPLLRMAIDNAGNIKMGDGAWTNYVNVTNAGVMTAVGTATITATTVTGFTPASGSLTLAGADALTLTTSAATNVTLPTTGTLLANVVEDTTPELGGEMDAGAHSIGFTLQAATGDGTTTIDWKLGNHFKFTHGAMAETFTFTAPSNPCNLTLIMVQDGVGGRDSTWPETVKWLGAEPTWTGGGASKGIVVGFLWDGTSYWAQATPWQL